MFAHDAFRHLDALSGLELVPAVALFRRHQSPARTDGRDEEGNGSIVTAASCKENEAKILT